MDGIDKHAAFYRAYLPAERSLVPMTIALATIVALCGFLFTWLSPSALRPRLRRCALGATSPRSLCSRRAADGAGQTASPGPRRHGNDHQPRPRDRCNARLRGRRAGGLFNLRRRLCLASTGGGGKWGRSDLGFLGCGAASTPKDPLGSGCIIFN